MNLKQFMIHGQICPICHSNSMNMRLSNSIRQSYRYEEDYIVFNREMRSLGKGSSYNIEYYIHGETSEVKIEFIHKDIKLKNSVSMEVISRFKDIDKNISPYCFNRTCTNCNKYHYYSNSIKIDLKNCLINDIIIAGEYFGVYKLVGAQYRVFRINNNYLSNKCDITCLNANDAGYAEWNLIPWGDNLILNLTPIKFTNEYDVSNRLNKLLPFI